MKLNLAQNLSLPIDAVTQTFAIFGKRGSGKTNGATVLVEEMLRANLPVVVLDPVDAWWGLKSSFDGKSAGLPVYVFGGPHADLPLESTAGTLVAELVVKERLPIILSMKTWGVGERARFVTDFSKTLLRTNSEPLMVVLEEADAFIPQRPAKGEEAMLGEMDRMVRWGRSSGIGCTLITQRSAKVNKDVTTQAETLIAFRTTGPQDRDAIDNWIKFHACQDRREALLSSLPELETGTAWVWSPEWLEVFDRYQFRRRQTYDSGATPKVGEHRPKPKELAVVDLERLRGQMAETIERAKANDPAELKRTIADLKRELQRVKSERPPEPSVAEIDREAISKLVELLKDETDRVDMNTILSSIRGLEAACDKKLKAVLELASVLSRKGAVVSAGAGRTVGHVIDRRAKISVVHSGNGSEISGGLRRMMIALAQRPGLSKKQLGVRAGLSSTSGTFGTYLGRMRSSGWVEGSETICLTQEGAAALGDYEPLPEGMDLLAYWLDELGSSGAGRMLRVLAEKYPEALSKEDLGRYAEISHTSGTFGTYLGKLRTLELVEGRGDLRASKEFFE